MSDTIKRAAHCGHSLARVAQTVSRADLWRALTPQMFRRGALSSALARPRAAGAKPTDEAQAMEWTGVAPLLVEGAPDNIKVTTAPTIWLGPVSVAGAGARRMNRWPRVGIGYDVHAFGPGDHVMLGGVRIAHTRGIVAHSDGDVACMRCATRCSEPWRWATSASIFRPATSAGAAPTAAHCCVTAGNW